MMNAMRIAMVLSGLLLLPSFEAPIFAQPGQNSRTSDVVPGVVVVKLKRSYAGQVHQTEKEAASMLGVFSGSGVSSLVRAFPSRLPLTDAEAARGKVDLSRLYYGTIPKDLNPRDVATRLASMPQVEYAEPKYYHYLCDIPNDSDYVPFQQVYFDRMNVPAAWSIQKGSAGVIIATVDGGTNWSHPDLAANIHVNPAEDQNHNGVFDHFAAPAGDENGADEDGNGYVDDVIGWNFSSKTNDPRGTLSISRDHGTKTASLFGAVTDNGMGMAGTSWNCQIMPVCAADQNTDGTILWGPEGIEYAAENGARIINCSWKRSGSDTVRHEQEIITAAAEGGALVIAAAGNDHHRNIDVDPVYPASYEHVLAVGATVGSSDLISTATNVGTCVGVFAPGTGIRVALDNGAYGVDSGTSMSAPLVAGLAGLLASAHPDWTPDQIAMQIRMTADPIDGSNPGLSGLLGHGRVNFYRALTEVHSGIDIVSGRFHKRADTCMIFMTGDTVILTVVLRNILGAAAENLAFNVTADPAFVPLLPVSGPPRLDPGGEDSVDVLLRIGGEARGLPQHVRVGWSANAADWGARIFQTTVYARTGVWTPQESHTKFQLFSVHAVSNRIAWATGMSAGGPLKPVVLRTTDGGELWENVTGTCPAYGGASVFAFDSLHAWVVGGREGGRLWVTSDGGGSWAERDYPPPLSNWAMRGVWFSDESYGYAVGDTSSSGKYVILRTTDGGDTWAHVPNEPAGDGALLTAANLICGTDRQHVWFGGSGPLVYRTTDGGDTWASATVGTGVVTAVKMHDSLVGIACTYDMTPTYARTTDGGASWQALSSVKPQTGWGIAFAGDSDVRVAGGAYVACSRDLGVNWVLEPTQPFSGIALAISFSDPANGWLVTMGGDILHYRAAAVGVEPGRGVELPGVALLEQNYPNPFNSTTVISYQLSVVSSVKLVVFDVLGREVGTLLDERRPAGIHTVRFDGSKLASGVYFYRMTARGVQGGKSTVLTRKLLLLK